MDRPVATFTNKMEAKKALVELSHFRLALTWSGNMEC